MPCLMPSLDPADAAANLEKLLSPRIDPAPFQQCIRRLRAMFAAFATSCPPPWPAPGLALTPEIHCQSELWLPLAEIRPAFHRIYRAALSHSPILSSTPFGNARSWAAIVSAYPSFFPGSADPATLLERLLADGDQRAAFLFRSFLPERFYGSDPLRYPTQTAFVAAWLADRDRSRGPLRCLDAACGDGSGSYGLARLLLEAGYGAGEFSIEGWTIDPLEVWAAAHAAFPHDPKRQASFRQWAAPVFEAKAQSSVLFKSVDLLGYRGQVPPFAKWGGGGISPTAELQSLPVPLGQAYGSPLLKGEAQFDLILCNGLLGGPIIHQREELTRVTGNLAALLRPGGLLLAADRFHGGWKRHCPEEALGVVFKACGLVVSKAGEGLAGGW